MYYLMPAKNNGGWNYGTKKRIKRILLLIENLEKWMKINTIGVIGYNKIRTRIL